MLSTKFRESRFHLAKAARHVNKHEHTPDDGRGRRTVLVDGKKIDKVFYANTLTGEVRFHESPFRVENGEAVSKTIYGRVEVVPLQDRS